MEPILSKWKQLELDGTRQNHMILSYTFIYTVYSKVYIFLACEDGPYVKIPPRSLWFQGAPWWHGPGPISHSTLQCRFEAFSPWGYMRIDTGTDVQSAKIECVAKWNPDLNRNGVLATHNWVMDHMILHPEWFSLKPPWIGIAQWRRASC